MGTTALRLLERGWHAVLEVSPRTCMCRVEFEWADFGNGKLFGLLQLRMSYSNRIRAFAHDVDPVGRGIGPARKNGIATSGSISRKSR